MKFLNREAFLYTLNTWIRDGSEIVDFTNGPTGEVVVLKGRDDAIEKLSFYFDADSDGYFENDEPNGDDGIPEKSNYKKAVDKIYDASRLLRVRLLHNFMSDPGMLATFGDNFDIEFGEVDLATTDLRHIDSFDLQIRQNMRFQRRKEADVTASPEGDSGGAEA